MKINKPKMKINDVKTFSDLKENEDFCNCEINKDVRKEFNISNVTFDSMTIKNINFGLIKLDKVDLLDVIFEDCDLSNLCFDEMFLTRVIFKNCKLSGTTFINATLEDIEFDNCNMKYTNFSGTKMNNIYAHNDNWTESAFISTHFKNVLLEEVKLNFSEFAESYLMGVDFSKCDIANIVWDLKSLKGIKVDAIQCQYFANMLGIEINDK